MRTFEHHLVFSSDSASRIMLKIWSVHGKGVAVTSSSCVVVMMSEIPSDDSRFVSTSPTCFNVHAKPASLLKIDNIYPCISVLRFTA